MTTSSGTAGLGIGTQAVHHVGHLGRALAGRHQQLDRGATLDLFAGCGIGADHEPLFYLVVADPSLGDHEAEALESLRCGLHRLTPKAGDLDQVRSRRAQQPHQQDQAEPDEGGRGEDPDGDRGAVHAAGPLVDGLVICAGFAPEGIVAVVAVTAADRRHHAGRRLVLGGCQRDLARHDAPEIQLEVLGGLVSVVGVLRHRSEYH
jgi:hypothetical protein